MTGPERKTPAPRPGDPISRLAGLCPVPDPVIVDGGANKGRITDRFLALFPGCRVAAFEPLPELARKLEKRFAADPRVTVRAQALGPEPGTASLMVLSRRTLSSVLPPTGIHDKYAGQTLRETARIEVPVVRLDAALPGGADIVKLDLQGYELAALRGALGILPRVRLILAETAFLPLYAGQPLFSELRNFLSARGFGFEGLYDPFFDKNGTLVSGDALFTAGPRAEAGRAPLGRSRPGRALTRE
ncbi:FkbM family methyltransferase [Desulfolutivibrio sulfoxidireducens]|uniref:FkbM family methyltransferase n=1 Tax=Desulfolutivibrio sulfoxidireducens TaxID=2773299 RepID=UPI00159DD536|nr:FkbM family methyltransferase [Desulfolutivibrio sulfoxidireducens]QLA17140.1 FkbM family methyltransferase [Desulfolutivibrio sulfoxidireducens]